MFAPKIQKKNPSLFSNRNPFGILDIDFDFKNKRQESSSIFNKSNFNGFNKGVKRHPFVQNSFNILKNNYNSQFPNKKRPTNYNKKQMADVLNYTLTNDYNGYSGQNHALNKIIYKMPYNKYKRSELLPMIQKRALSMGMKKRLFKSEVPSFNDGGYGQEIVKEKENLKEERKNGCRNVGEDYGCYNNNNYISGNCTNNNSGDNHKTAKTDIYNNNISNYSNRVIKQYNADSINMNQNNNTTATNNTYNPPKLSKTIEKVSPTSLSKYNFTSDSNVISEYAYKEDPNIQYREYMEDKGRAFDCFNNDRNQALFLLFDGHGGGETSKFLQEKFGEFLKQKIKMSENEGRLNNDPVLILNEFFPEIDNIIKESPFANVGSTAALVYFYKKNGKKFVVSANLGDTRVVLVSKGGVKRLSYDHRATDKAEYERIVNSGGVVFAGRVAGQLMLSRALGDWEIKSYGVSSVPFITKTELSNEDEFVVMATDGVWDVLEDETVGEMCLKSGGGSGEICGRIVGEAMERGSMDNLSCFVVKIN